MQYGQHLKANAGHEAQEVKLSVANRSALGAPGIPTAHGSPSNQTKEDPRRTRHKAGSCNTTRLSIFVCIVFNHPPNVTLRRKAEPASLAASCAVIRQERSRGHRSHLPPHQKPKNITSRTPTARHISVDNGDFPSITAFLYRCWVAKACYTQFCFFFLTVRLTLGVIWYFHLKESPVGSSCKFITIVVMTTPAIKILQ